MKNYRTLKEEEERFIPPEKTINTDYEAYIAYGNKAERSKYCGGRFTKKQIIYFSMLGCLIVAGLILLLTFLVFIPMYAQSCLDDSSVDITYLRMSDPTNTSSLVFANLVINSDTPFKVKIPEFTLTLSYQGKDIGDTQSPEFTIDKSEVGIEINSTLWIQNQQAFNAFSTDIVELSELTLHMKGSLKMKVDIGLFDYTVHDLDFSKNVQIIGCDGLKNISITHFDILTTKTGDLNITINAIMWNPSIVEIIPLGIMTFDLYYNNVFFGTSVSDYSNLLLGDNFMFLSGLLAATVPTDDLNEMFGSYLNGFDVPMDAVGAGCSIALYEPSVRSLNLSIIVQGAQTGVIVAGYMELDRTEVIAGFKQGIFVDPTVLYLSNTFGANSLLIQLHQDITYQGKKIGRYYSAESSVVRWKNISIPAYSKVYTWPFPIEMDTTDNPDSFIQSLISELENGIVTLGVNGTMTFVMGNFVCTPYYIQDEYDICTEENVQACGLEIPSSAGPIQAQSKRTQSFSTTIQVKASTFAQQN